MTMCEFFDAWANEVMTSTMAECDRRREMARINKAALEQLESDNI